MTRFIFIVAFLVALIGLFGFYNTSSGSKAADVKKHYLTHTSHFIAEAKSLQEVVDF